MFSRPKIVQQVAAPEPKAPDPRDEEARAAAERMRRSGLARGRQSTVLTQFTRRNRVGDRVMSGPRRTVIGAGGS
ncbi:MAG: hypothetical protein BroJett013_30460 [Alphaproteobacteria bacterium]|nr:MAG: hypothetical protein BroJett013_30460 [Alphaproteobacteria bacterium]